jgi:hypothetical protein
MTEAIITDNQTSIVVESYPTPEVVTVGSVTTPEVVVVSNENTLVIGMPEQQTTVVAGILGPPGPRGNSASAVATYTFDISLEWLVVHNKNTSSFVPALFDSAGSQFFAKVNIIDNNKFAVKLTEAISGSVAVIFQGL